MPKFTLYIKDTKTRSIEIEAGSAEEAEQEMWDQPEEEFEVNETDSTVEYMTDDQGNTYHWSSRPGEWRPEPRREKR